MKPDIKMKLAAQGGRAAAFHLEGDKIGAVAIWSLSVLIVPDEEFWFAQGLEINYGAQGDTPEEARINFQDGLVATIRQHLRMHGDITRILTFAPDETLKEAAQHKSSIHEFAQVSFHEIANNEIGDGEYVMQNAVPFDNIRYLVQAA
jgi:hypothetical protein